MKNGHLILAFVPFLFAGCGTTRIVTVSPDLYDARSYTTTVTVPVSNTVTTTTRVMAADADISLYLDLQAVAAAFAQSSSVQEFESLLNNSSYMLSNLDLNRDGYVDYLRVLETVNGYAHVFVIQAVLGYNVYQDVATLVAELPSPASYYVQVIGSPYIYGPNYIIQPVYYTTPAIFGCLIRPAYRPWSSPWYWDHFPVYYKRPVTVYVSHYQAYVRTYMGHHHYCHEVVYAPSCHYVEYDRISRPIQRNDYGRMYPERSFTVRNANTPARGRSAVERAASSGMVVNARDIIENQEASTVTRTAPAAAGRSSATSSSRTSAPASSGSRISSSGTRTSSSATRTPSSGTRTTQSSGSRSASSSTAAPAPAKTTTPSSSQPSTGTRNGSTTSQTTVRSRVNASGTSDTRISTKSSEGIQSTTRRSSSSPSSSSTSGNRTPSRSSGSSSGGRR